MGKTLLLTGATGFLGRNFLNSVLEKNLYRHVYLPVRSLEKLRRNFKEDGIQNLPNHITPIVGDARGWGFDNLSVDHVVHAAGLLFSRSRESYFQVNTYGTVELFQRLRNIKKAIVISSQAAAGPNSPSQGLREESDEDCPVTWYGESKLEMERSLSKQFSDLNFIVLRPPMILGPRDSATLPLFKMVKNPLQFKPGLKPKHYSFIDVADLVEAMEIALQGNQKLQDKRVFFIASRETISDETLITTAAQLSQRKARTLRVPQPIIWLAHKVIDQVPAWRKAIPVLAKNKVNEIWPYHWIISPQSFEACFGWKAKSTFHNALNNAYQWYRMTKQID